MPLIPLESSNRHLFNSASGKSGNNGADQRLSERYPLSSNTVATLRSHDIRDGENPDCAWSLHRHPRLNQLRLIFPKSQQRICPFPHSSLASKPCLERVLHTWWYTVQSLPFASVHSTSCVARPCSCAISSRRASKNEYFIKVNQNFKYEPEQARKPGFCKKIRIRVNTFLRIKYFCTHVLLTLCRILAIAYTMHTAIYVQFYRIKPPVIKQKSAR